MIDKNELKKLIDDERKEDARIINLEEKEECLSERQKGHRDSGMNEGDFY